jgi:DNA transformation protein
VTTDALIEHVRDLLASMPDIRFRKMFGGAGVYSGGRMFAVDRRRRALHQGRRPDPRRVRSGGLTRITMETKDGRTMAMNYWRLPAGAEDTRPRPSAGRGWAWRGGAGRAPKPKRRARPRSRPRPGPGMAEDVVVTGGDAVYFALIEELGASLRAHRTAEQLASSCIDAGL